MTAYLNEKRLHDGRKSIELSFYPTLELGKTLNPEDKQQIKAVVDGFNEKINEIMEKDKK